MCSLFLEVLPWRLEDHLSRMWKVGYPKKLQVPPALSQRFGEMRGGVPAEGRVSAENLALWARMQGGRGLRGERPRPREGCAPARGALPSTLKTAQKETWSTEVNPSRTGRDWPSAPRRPLSHRLKGHKNVALLVPQGSFLFPFPGSNSILHSDWPAIPSLFLTC